MRAGAARGGVDAPKDRLNRLIYARAVPAARLAPSHALTRRRAPRPARVTARVAARGLAVALSVGVGLVASGCHEVFGNQFYVRGVGDPCSRDAECEASGAGRCLGCPSGGCVGWCTPTCDGASDCEGSSGGKNGRGGTNECLVSTGGESVCFPGCARDADCDAFASSDCVPSSDESRVCAENPYGPCKTDQDCALAGPNAFCNVNFGGCQAPCDEPSDCQGGGVCAQTTAGEGACFAACITASDCDRYVGARCVNGTDPYGYSVQGCSS